MGANLKFRPDIEGLRGIAVLLVVLYHAGTPGIQGGFIGVDVFFVLSGYLITQLLLKESEATGRVALVAFYARRARRLIPAAVLTVAATLAVAWLLLPPLALLESLKTGLAAATYWSNLRFAVEAGDYFGADLTRDPLLHMWSLAVEEQFYVVWPLLVAAAAAVAGGRRRTNVAIVLGGVSVASFVASLWLSNSAPHWAFFGTHARAWEFGVGALAGFVTIGRRAAAWAGPVGVALIVLSGVFISSSLAWPGWWAVLPVAGTALALLAGEAAPTARLLNVRPLQGLGRLSYTWYLWHWPALVLVEAAAGPLALWQRLLVAAGALGLSALTHRLVENPLRFHPRLVRSPWASVSVMVAVSVVTMGAAASLVPGIEAQQRRYVEAARDLPRSYREGCHLQVPEAAPKFECVYGVEDSEVTVVLFGDSHATQWFPALERVALEHGWRLVVHTKSSCSGLSVNAVLAEGRAYDECNAWREAVLANLEADPPAVVVLAAYAATVTQDGEALSAGLQATIERLSPVVGTVAYVLDNPAPGFDGPGCLSTVGAARCSFDREQALQRHAWETDGTEGALVVDVTRDVCAGPVCRLEAGGMVVFRDQHHVTASFAKSLAPRFAEALAPSVARAASR